MHKWQVRPRTLVTSGKCDHELWLISGWWHYFPLPGQIFSEELRIALNNWNIQTSTFMQFLLLSQAAFVDWFHSLIRGCCWFLFYNLNDLVVGGMFQGETKFASCSNIRNGRRCEFRRSYWWSTKSVAMGECFVEKCLTTKDLNK